METPLKYETPLWTLIGVFIGFILSYLYGWIVQKRQYISKTNETTQRIIRVMHLSDSKQAIQRLADLIPQFKEKEQIKILSEIGLESSLNADTDDVTQCIIDELQWICVLYEVDRNNIRKFAKKSREDQKKIKAVQNGLWEILLNIVEYRQSEKLLHSAFNLLDILNNYSMKQGYEKVILSSINLYKEIGKLSVGIEYADSGYKVLDFRVGIDESIKKLRSLQSSLRQSFFKNSKVFEFSNAIDEAIRIINKEYTEKIS